MLMGWFPSGGLSQHTDRKRTKARRFPEHANKNIYVHFRTSLSAQRSPFAPLSRLKVGGCKAKKAGCITQTANKWFISETPVAVRERTSMKEHLVWHGSKHKIQVHTTKRNKGQQEQNKIVRISKTKQQRETRERSLTKTKARGKN